MANVEYLEWGGFKWRRYPDSKHKQHRVYFQRMGRKGSLLLHRAVWESVHGPIPDGHHIHHIDHNPGNNDVSNLACLTVAEHRAQHEWGDEQLERQAEHLARIRHLTKEWHASDAGREVHRRIGALAYRDFVPEPKPCKQCSTVFTPGLIGNRDYFCSNNCKSAHRRASGVDNVDRDCCVCGKSFRVNRYSTSKSCSRSCAGRARGRTMRSRVRPDG